MKLNYEIKFKMTICGKYTYLISVVAELATLIFSSNDGKIFSQGNTTRTWFQ